MIHAFNDPTINVHGAQLVFTSHTYSVLERASELGLDPNGFWSVDKTAAGESRLTHGADERLASFSSARSPLSQRSTTASRAALDALRALVTTGA